MTLDELDNLIQKFNIVETATFQDIDRLRRAGLPFRIVPTKWVFKSKKLATGEFNRRKTRLVACEAVSRFPNVPNTWSPTIALDTLRFVIIVALLTDSKMLSLDISAAYLRGKPDPEEEPVFLRLPPGLDDMHEEIKSRNEHIDPEFVDKLLYLSLIHI